MAKPPVTRMSRERSAIMAGVSSGISQDAMAAQLSQAKSAFADIPSIFNAPAAQPTAESLQYGQGPAGGPQPGMLIQGNTGPDDYSAYGLGSNVPRSLITTESSGNWGATNTLGYRGLLQFGAARFTDAQRAGVVPQGMSFEAWGADTPAGRAAQAQAYNWHFNDIDNKIRAAGYDKLLGQNIGGVPLTMDSMRSMAHLGGFGGLSSFIKSNGSDNRADAYGTSLASYGRTHQ